MVTSHLVYLANFLKPKIYSNFYQKKFFILANVSHLAYLANPTLRKKTLHLSEKNKFFKLK